MIKIESVGQVVEILGKKFGDTKSIILNDKQTGLQERHSFGTESGISKGSYMSDQQTLGLRDEVRQGEDSVEVTERYNLEMGIAD